MVARARQSVEWDEAVRSWIRSLRAERKSPKTLQAYEISLERLVEFLEVKGMPTRPEAISGEHIREWVNDMLDRNKPASVRLRIATAKVFFRWLVDEGEIKSSPLERVKNVQVPETPPPVLTDEQLKALIVKCEKDKTFLGARDTAILRIFIDTGARLSEVAKLKVADVDLDRGLLYVMGKGSRPRSISMGDKSIKALDRYLRQRSKQDRAGSIDKLWLGRTGVLDAASVARMIKRRGKEVGITGLHPQLFRHTAAHLWMASGGSEGGLMKQAGWRRSDMLRRYGASAAAERSHTEHRKLGIGDRF